MVATMTPALNDAQLAQYTLRLADNCLVLGHRLSEWCGHGPVLEEDMALTNIALDHIGQAQLYLSLAGEIEGLGRSADDLAYHRDGGDFRNLLLVEQPNGDFGQTIVRQFLFDCYYQELLTHLVQSSHQGLADIAARSVKESAYHLRHSSRWMVRLGDGTDESHRRVQTPMDDLWRYTGEMFSSDDVDDAVSAAGFAPPPASLEPGWRARVEAVLAEATLTMPSAQWMASGGKQGRHSEHLGRMLAEMQSLARSHPAATW